MASAEALYKQVKSGKVKLEQLNDAGKAALKQYMATKKQTEEATKKYGTNEQRAGSAMARQDAEEQQALRGKSLDDIGMGFADQSKRFKEFDTGIQAKAVQQEETRKAAQTPYEKWYENNISNSFIGKTLNKLQGADRAVSNFKAGALDTATLGATQGLGRAAINNIPEGETNLKPIFDERLKGTDYKAGQFAGYVVPGALADRAVVKLGGEALKRLPKIAQGLVRGSASGALDAAAQEGGDVAFREGTFDPLNVALGAGIGGGLGALVPTIGKAFQAFKNRGSSVAPEAEQAVRSAFDGSPPKVMGNLRNATQDQYVNRIMRQIKDDVNQRMTPPLENPNELAKWLKTHLGDDISLNEIRKLPFEDMRQLSDEVRKNMSMYDVARQVAKERGFNLDEVFAGKLPSIKDTVARDASRRAYGVGEAPNIGIQRTVRPEGPQLPKGTNDIPLGSNSLNDTPTVSSTQATRTAADETPLVSNSIESLDPQGFKDISGFSAQTRDLYRNMEKVMGKEHAAPYLEMFNVAKKDNIEMQEYWVNRLKTEVVDKLKIQKGSKLSALVQKFGEKNITLDELKAQHPEDWEKVVEADNWFRTSYDNLIDIVNESRVKVYPNNPDKIVPKRSDYYRHFRELNGLEGLKNLFDSPSAIDPSLAGVSDFTSPRSKFAGFMQKRGLGPYKNDAVGGFLNYLPSASYATKIDPQISNFRSLASALADTTGESRNVNNFIEFLNDFSNDLSGKTNPWDRAIQKTLPGGRKTMAAVSWLSNRVKTNVILGNLGSTLAQMANIPNGIAFAKQHAVEGAGKALKAIFKQSDEMKESGFLKERFAGKMYRQFDKDWISLRNPLHTKKLAEWMMETSDRVGTTFVWNSAYAKGVAENVANPVSYADDATRKLVAGRGVGEVPLFQKARITQLVLPFQLEVANLWRVMGDFVGKKDFGAIAVLFAANYVFNRGMEQVKGSGVVFDPIQAMIEALDKDLTPTERAGRLAGEVFSNLPGGQLAASVFPEYGGNVLGMKVPTRKKLFGDNDPTRFGSGVPLQKAFSDPLHTLVPGFGGNQIKKMTQGFDSIRKGGSLTKKGELRFSIKQTPAKIAQQILFGPNATSEAQKYFKEGRRPLGVKDTKTYQSIPEKDREKLYKDIINKREREKLERQINDIMKDDSLLYIEKTAKIEELELVLKLKPYMPGGEKYVPKGS